MQDNAVYEINSRVWCATCVFDVMVFYRSMKICADINIRS